MIKYYVIKHLILLKIQNCDEYQRDLASLIYKLFVKKSSGSSVKSETMPNQQLSEELHQLIIIKVVKRKLCSSFKDSILGADFVDMQLISKFNKGFQFLL